MVVVEGWKEDRGKHCLQGSAQHPRPAREGGLHPALRLQQAGSRKRILREGTVLAGSGYALGQEGFRADGRTAAREGRR